MNETLYSTNGEWFDLTSIGDVIDDLTGDYDENEVLGMEYYSNKFKKVEPSEYLDVGQILDQANDFLYDNAGNPDDSVTCFTDVSDDAKAELQALLKYWCDKHVKCDLYEPVGDMITHVVTKEDLA